MSSISGSGNSGGSGVGTVRFLQGNSGGPVGPNPANIIFTPGGTNITTVGDAGTFTVTINGNILTYTGIVFADSPYSAALTDYYISADVTGGAITVRLPNAPTTGTIFAIKDKVGLAGTSNITITTVGGVVNLDGATSFVMNTNYESASVIFNGVSYEIY